MTLRRIGSGLLLCALLALAACAHAPVVPQPAPQVTMTVAPAAPAPAAADASSSAAGSNVTETTVGPEPVERIDPATYADLFDRMRAGFALADVESPAVAQQLTWFVENPDYVQRSFRRAELYLYHIVTQLEARHMPLELALLPVIESAFEPYAYSRARAMGLWQFIPGTGSRFGLKQNWWYDGRRDVIESTRAALDYLQALHDEFKGDWLLAIAAYNCGEMAVAQAVAANQAAGRPIDFWDLRLPAETRAYVPKLLAMKRLVTNPETYGLTFSAIPNQPYFVRVDTQGQIDLRVAAEIAGVTPDVIYELNPAFHRWATDPSGPYYLLLPTAAADVFRANVAALTPDERMQVKHYEVHRGDTMAAVARHFGTRPQVIRELNDLPNGALVVGADLRVPSNVRDLPPQVLRAAALVDARDRRVPRPRMRVVVHRGDSLWAIARRHGVDVHTLALINGMQIGDPLRAGQHLRLTATPRHVADDDETLDPPSPRHAHASVAHARHVTYIVRAGDTLYRIARVFQVSVAEIVRWNRLSHATALLPGQRLLIHLAAR